MIIIVDKSGSTIHEGDIDFATNDPGKAFRDADVIMITMPPPMMIPLAQLRDHCNVREGSIAFTYILGRFKVTWSIIY